MELKEANKIYNALNTLKTYCEEHGSCLGCLCQSNDGGCLIVKKLPQDWRIKKPTCRVFENDGYET